MTIARITITLPVEGADTATNPEVRAALDHLAAAMLVQAEDGLWTLGSPDAESDEGPSTYLRGIGSGATYALAIEDDEQPEADEPEHHHEYRSDIADWWCHDCDTVTDFCQQINPS